jgi:hypothetical protein
LNPEKAKKFNRLHLVFQAKLARITIKDINLVIMNTAGEVLLKQIYEKGQCILIQNDEKLSKFKMISYAKIADFGYHHAKMQAGLLKSIKEETSIG